MWHGSGGGEATILSVHGIEPLMKLGGPKVGQIPSSHVRIEACAEWVAHAVLDLRSLLRAWVIESTKGRRK